MDKHKVKNDRKHDTEQTFLSSQLGAFAARHQANATDEAIKGMGLLKMVGDKLRNVGVDQKQGNLFEIIEATKFNMDAAVKGIDNVRAHVTALEGDPHAAADIVIKHGGKVIDEVQAKSTNKASRAAMMFRNEKYNDMQKLTNPEHAETVKRITEVRAESNGEYSTLHKDTAQNVTGGLNSKEHGISSKGTSNQEAIRAAQNTDQYANNFQWNQAGKEMLQTGGQAALVGGMVGGAISIVKNAIAVNKDEKTKTQAVICVAKDTGKAAARSGTVGVIGAGIRASASHHGISALAKSNVATAIAAGAVDCGVTLLKYAKGEISGADAAEKMGGTGVSTASSIYAGAAAGAVFGPVGALVGSIGGYMLASGIYQSAMAILKNAALSELEAQRIIAICDEASEEMRKQRMLFEQMIQEQLEYNDAVFKKCFTTIEKGLQSGRFKDTVLALENMNKVFGKQLKLVSFNDFDRHMKKGLSLEL